MKILIVDDSLFAINRIKGLVQELSPESNIVGAKSAIDALKLCEEDSMDLVLVDYNMPEMNGIELGKKINSMSKHTQIALVSASSGFKTNAIEIPEYIKYFSKPIDPKLLKEYLSKVKELVPSLDKKKIEKSLNEGIAQAAKDLKSMFGLEHEITYSCLEIEYIKETSKIDQKIFDGKINFQSTIEGHLRGSSVFSISVESAMEFVKLMNIPHESPDVLTNDFASESINLILNSCLSSIGGEFNIALTATLPQKINNIEELKTSESYSDQIVCLVEFENKEDSFNGIFEIILSI